MVFRATSVQINEHAILGSNQVGPSGYFPVDPLVYMMIPMSVGPGVTGCTSGLSQTFLPRETTSQKGTIWGSPGKPATGVDLV